MDNRSKSDVIKVSLKNYSFQFDPNTRIATLFKGRKCQRIWEGLGFDKPFSDAKGVVYNNS